MDFTTVIEPVLEVTLPGVAEDQLWRELLHQEGLPIFSQQGQARILVSLVDSRYMGMRFQELSVSVQVAENQYFLAQAYNSIALFALAERTFFQTPYYKGSITCQPHHITLHVGSTLLLEADLAAETPFAVKQWECNELQIYLPDALHKRSNRLHFFHARLEGDTETYQTGFTLRHIGDHPHHSVWGLLQASGFKVLEWRIRAAARHSKSKTLQA